MLIGCAFRSGTGGSADTITTPMTSVSCIKLQYCRPRLLKNTQARNHGRSPACVVLVLVTAASSPCFAYLVRPFSPLNGGVRAPCRGGVQACLAQQERVVNKANEYRLFGHGLACYFVDRLSNWRNLQVTGEVVLPGGRGARTECCRHFRRMEGFSLSRDRPVGAILAKKNRKVA